MKRLLTLAIVLAVMLGRVFGQQPSLSFTGPTSWTPGTSVTLSTNLTYANFNALGLSYWLQTNSALTPFLSITNVNYFTFTIRNYTGGFPAPFGIDLGATVNPSNGVSPGTYHITDITFALAAGAPVGSYTISTTTLAPRVSSVTDSLFGDHPIAPSSFVLQVVPEPSTQALLTLVAVATGIAAYRRGRT